MHGETDNNDRKSIQMLVLQERGKLKQPDKTSRCRVQNQQTQRISKKVDTEQKLLAIVSRVALRLTFSGLSTRLREDLMDIHTTSPHGQTLN